MTITEARVESLERRVVELESAIWALCFGMAVVVVFGVQAIAALVPTVRGIIP